jgi:hypothetical protein
MLCPALLRRHGWTTRPRRAVAGSVDPTAPALRAFTVAVMCFNSDGFSTRRRVHASCWRTRKPVLRRVLRSGSAAAGICRTQWRIGEGAHVESPGHGQISIDPRAGPPRAPTTTNTHVPRSAVVLTRKYRVWDFACFLVGSSPSLCLPTMHASAAFVSFCFFSLPFLGSVHSTAIKPCPYGLLCHLPLVIVASSSFVCRAFIISTVLFLLTFRTRNKTAPPEETVYYFTDIFVSKLPWWRQLLHHF